MNNRKKTIIIQREEASLIFNEFSWRDLLNLVR